MIIIPEHVKKHVDRIIAQYEAAYEERRSFSRKITVGDKEYVGLQTTQFWLEDLKQFRTALETQELAIFQGTEEDVIAKIYNAIQDYYEPLNAEAISEITKVVWVQSQLRRELKKAAKKRRKTCQEARGILDYIKNAKHIAWSQDDECVQRKIFKLVKTNEEFEFILKSNKDKCTELTVECSEPFEMIRIAMVEISFKEQYQSKHIVKEYKKLFDAHKLDWKQRAFDQFNFWHDVMNTAVYYVFIPQE